MASYDDWKLASPSGYDSDNEPCSWCEPWDDEFDGHSEDACPIDDDEKRAVTRYGLI